jgi:hypothetical protein
MTPGTKIFLHGTASRGKGPNPIRWCSPSPT